MGPASYVGLQHGAAMFHICCKKCRIHPMTRANYLASPPLVIAYALAGTVLTDFDNEPTGESVIVIDTFAAERRAAAWLLLTAGPPDMQHTHTFNGSLSRTTRVSWYLEGKTNLDVT